jgi:hypothetical protein
VREYPPRSGRPLPRDEASNPPPCYKCPKVPEQLRKERQAAGKEVVPADAVEPDDEARRVLAFFLECDAVGRFPADPLFRRYAAVIRPYAKASDEQPQRELISLIRRLVTRR